jgi:hypothetical protein
MILYRLVFLFLNNGLERCDSECFTAIKNKIKEQITACQKKFPCNMRLPVSLKSTKISRAPIILIMENKMSVFFFVIFIWVKTKIGYSKLETTLPIKKIRFSK